MTTKKKGGLVIAGLAYFGYEHFVVSSPHVEE